MKLFTRFAFSLALLALPIAAAFARVVDVTIGNNFYSPVTVDIAPGDQINFMWQAGFHPTVSDSPTSAWPTFTLSASNRSMLLPVFNTVGVYPYHCSAHGTPTTGQTGVIRVMGTPSAASDPRQTYATFNVFPNPSHGQLTVQLTQKAGADYKLRLSNIIGQEIRTIALKPELTAAGLPLDLSDLRAGVYFYSLVVDGRTLTTKRLVLQE